MAIWFSSSAFRTRDISTMLVQAQAAGIRNIELSSGMDYATDMLQPVREAHTLGSHRFLVHNYFPPPEAPFVLNIASPDPYCLAQTRAFGEQALHLAKELGAPFYSIHAGFAARLRPEHLGQPEKLATDLTAADIDRTGAYEVMVETTRHLADHAATLGLDLLIENNVIAPVFMERMPINPLLLTSSGEIRSFFDDVQRTNVGLLLDIAHAKVSATALGFSPEEFVGDVAEYVRCLHLSDNNGREDSNQPMNSETWFLPQLKNFRGCEIVMEAYRLEPDEMKAQLALIQHYMD